MRKNLRLPSAFAALDARGQVRVAGLNGSRIDPAAESQRMHWFYLPPSKRHQTPPAFAIRPEHSPYFSGPTSCFHRAFDCMRGTPPQPATRNPYRGLLRVVTCVSLLTLSPRPTAYVGRVKVAMIVSKPITFGVT
jgi:hypothetical protein